MLPNCCHRRSVFVTEQQGMLLSKITQSNISAFIIQKLRVSAEISNIIGQKMLV